MFAYHASNLFAVTLGGSPARMAHPRQALLPHGSVVNMCAPEKRLLPENSTNGGV